MTPNNTSPHADIQILVVDDTPVTLGATTRVLRQAGYTVLEAVTGLEGLKIIKAVKPDLILLDVVLPDINGIELCKVIKTDPTLSDIFVITMSGIKTAADDQATGLEHGADGYIVRPVGNRELLARVEAMLRLKNALRRLQQSEARFRRVVNNSPDTIYTLDLTARQATFLNRESFCGYTVDELKTPGLLLKAVHPDDKAAVETHWKNITTQPADRETGSIEYRLRHKDGEWEWIQSREIVLERDAAGRPIQLLVTLTIITARKQAQETLARQAAELERSNTELAQFAYVASHDLQEPLRMVTGFMKLLKSRHGNQLDSEAQEFVAYAVDGAERMQRMIGDMLKYSRLNTRAKPFAPTDCQAVMKQVLDNLQLAVEDSQAAITCDPLPTVRSDDVQLSQLFQNLLSNAIKFRSENAPQIHISAQAGQQEWLFSVRDNGIGLEPTHAHRIFELFQRLHSRDEYPGTGMGLAICKKIVERHGGRIWVESQPGQGATFYFTLPYEDP